MRRRLLSITAVASLLVCGLVLYAWIADHDGDSHVVICQGTKAFGIISFEDHLYAGIFWRGFGGDALRAFKDSRGSEGSIGMWYDYVLQKYGHTWMGFGRVAPKGTEVANGILPYATLVMVPDWFVLLAFAILPAYLTWLNFRAIAIRRYRRKHSMCARCGYDLRGSAQRCPECGLARGPEGRG